MSTQSSYKMNDKLGVIMILIAATGMAMVGTFSRGATKGLLPEDKAVIGSFLSFGRMTTAMFGFLLIAIITGKFHDLWKAKVSFSVIMGGVSIGLSLGFYISSTLMTSIANAVFLIYTGPLFCAILARIFRKEHISLMAGGFLAMVFVGMLMTIGIIDWENGHLSFGLDLSGASAEYPQKPLGDLFGFLSGVFYGLSMFFYGYRRDKDSTVRGFWNFVCAASAALVMSIILRPWHGVASFTASNWGWAVILFIVCGLIALGSLVVAGRNLVAVKISTISYWECPVAIFLGVVVWGESMTVMGAIGGLLIIIGGIGPILFRDKAAAPVEEGDALQEVEAR